MNRVKACVRLLCAVSVVASAFGVSRAEPTPRNNMDKPIHGPGPQRNGVDPERQPRQREERPAEVYVPPPPLPPSPPIPYSVVAVPEVRVNAYRGWRYVPAAPAGVVYPATVIYRYDTWLGGGSVLRTWRRHSNFNADWTLVRPGQSRSNWYDPHEAHRAASSLELFFDLVLLVLLVAVLVWRPPVTATR